MIGNIKTFTAVLLMAASAATNVVAADTFGYCTDAVSRNNVYRLGSAEQQGQAVRLDGEKLALMKDAKITGLSVVFGSRQVDGGTATLFLAEELGGTPIAETTVVIPAAVAWSDVSFDTPYTIKGTETALYAGFTVSTTGKPLHADGQASAEDCSYSLCDGVWMDSYEVGRGNVSLRVAVDGAQPFADLQLKPVSTEGYFKAGEKYPMSTQVFNFGTATVSAFELSVAVGEGKTATTSYSDLNLKQGETMKVELPDFEPSTDGDTALRVTLTKINGGDDAAASDNLFEGSIYCYPAKMERTLLLEGFTGMECSNCPGGHKYMEAYLEEAPLPVVEVMHHAGYYPDYFTMAEDIEYTYFYNGGNFAPAFMMNRTTNPFLDVKPVVQTVPDNLECLGEYVAKQQPYVSLSLETTYDEATRHAEITLRSLAHVDLPAERNVLNVFLCQDNMSAYQKPYSSYTHNRVFRGALTGNAWGLQLPDEACKAGGRAEWTLSYDLPETIFSSYWEDKATDADRIFYDWKAKAEDITLVGFVGALGKDVNSCQVYNAVEARLGQSTTQGGWSGLETIDRDNGADAPEIGVEGGRIVVKGFCDSLEAFTIDGRSADAAASLQPGLYIVRATAGKNVAVKKILVK